MSLPDPDMRRPSDEGSESESEELAHYDDAVIGKAFKWSVIAFIFAALSIAITLLIMNRDSQASPSKVTEMQPPVAPERPRAEVPTVAFTDVTREAGLEFVHENGAYGDKLLPETMGGGVAFFDFDNDGDQDLLFINGKSWPWRESNGPEATSQLYENDGKGHFSNVTPGSGLDLPLYGMGVAVGDYDKDGWVDVYVTAVGENRLFRNRGEGQFEDVTASAGVAGSKEDWSTSAVWVDMDKDGDLDLFVCNYVQWNREIDFEVGYTLVGVGRAYGPPMNFGGSYPVAYRNDGEGQFTDISKESGIRITNRATGVPLAKSLGVIAVDINEDGWMDLVVANDTVPNFLFLNQKDGTFEEIGEESGLAFDSYGNTRGAMGIDAAYHRNNDRLAIGIGNFANEMTALYVSQNSRLTFFDEAITEGVGPDSRLLLKFGLFFFDYDLDGWLDLLTANGHIEDEINKVQQSQSYKQRAQLFWNANGTSQGGFVEVSEDKAGGDLFQPIVGRGSAFADIDQDGDLDIVLTQVGGPPLLLRNDQRLGHHWIRVRLKGKQSPTDAVGALVELHGPDGTQRRQVMTARSYLSQSELPVTFGLGQEASAEKLVIHWPSGQVQELPAPALDRLTVIEEPDLAAAASTRGVR